MKILSIHLGHDSSVCLYNKGIVEKYFLVERYSRIKHDNNLKVLFSIIFDNIDLKEIDYVCVSSIFNEHKNISILRILNKIKKYNKNIIIKFNHNHHLNHAALSFYNSKFDKSLVVVVDGCGSSTGNNLHEVESVFLFNGNECDVIYKNVVFNPTTNLNGWPVGKIFEKKSTSYDHKNICGIGGLYDIAALLTGNTMDDCGKAMALSSYGEDNYYFKRLFLEENKINNNFYNESCEKIKQFLCNPIKEINEKNYKLHSDFCHEVQIQTQKAVGDIIENAILKTKVKNVCISGGYGMNIVSNYYYLKRFPNVQFYFEPLSNDNGASIGCAILTYTTIFNGTHIPLETTSFHGNKNDISSYKGEKKSIKQISNLLYENKSVAVYTGLSEAGQRALGNRSILFNALNPNAKTIVNKIKKREWYRPFAAIVLEEDANIYFDMGKIKKSPFMTICFPVREKYSKIIPGVTHVDNTCRIQTISKSHPYLHELLLEFKNVSGHGILLNTSFNLAGEPLVETPEEAFNVLNNSSLDGVWFEETHQYFENKTIK